MKVYRVNCLTLYSFENQEIENNFHKMIEVREYNIEKRTAKQVILNNGQKLNLSSMDKVDSIGYVYSFNKENAINVLLQDTLKQIIQKEKELKYLEYIKRACDEYLQNLIES